MENAVVTKISNAEIRTTHITVIVKDIGIEIGKMAYWNARRFDDLALVLAKIDRLKVLTLLAVFSLLVVY